MTRKHFELIANALKVSGAPLNVIRKVAEELATTNPRFNEEQFINAACAVHVKG